MEVTREDVEEVIKKIEEGWQDEMIGGFSQVDFKDFTPYKEEIERRIADKGIKAKIDYNMYIKIDYIR